MAKEGMTKERTWYLDYIRIIGTLAVIMLHVSSYHFSAVKVTSSEWAALNFYDAIVRYAVPLFLMLSGALFLSPDKELDLKKAFERDLEKQEKQFQLDEQALLEAIAKCLANNKGISALMGYDTDEMLAFLQKPVSEIKQIVGGDWAQLEDIQLEPLIYSLAKKVKKSISLLDRTRK